MNLSTKEVNYLKDLLSWELMGAKRCAAYAKDTVDPNWAKIHDDTSRAHQDNFVDLLNYVNSRAKEVQ
ncbi:MAG: hypothetical protein GX922_09160 [Firmicutes bacterium]|nr:hypothetical protein [Bacillota bacterium]